MPEYLHLCVRHVGKKKIGFFQQNIQEVNNLEGNQHENSVSNKHMGGMH
jgi:hypothetical protein